MDEDVMNNVAVRVKLSLTVWDFTLPLTPSLPAVFGVSWQYSPLVCSNVLAYYDMRNSICLLCGARHIQFAGLQLRIFV